MRIVLIVLGVLLAIPVVAFVVLAIALHDVDFSENRTAPDLPLAVCVRAFNAGSIDWAPRSGQPPQPVRSAGRIGRRVLLSGWGGGCQLRFDRGGGQTFALMDDHNGDP